MNGFTKKDFEKLMDEQPDMENRLYYYTQDSKDASEELLLEGLKDYDLEKEDLEVVTGGYQFDFSDTGCNSTRVLFLNELSVDKTKIVGSLVIFMSDYIEDVLEVYNLVAGNN